MTSGGAAAGPSPTAAGDAPDPDVLAARLRALANPRRLRLLDFLAAPRSMQEIERHLGIARQNAQEHIDQLLAIGVVEHAVGPPGPGGAPFYVLAPQRLFTLQRMFARLGDVDPPERLPRVATDHLEGGPRAPPDADVPRLTVVHSRRVGHALVLAGEGPWLLGRDPVAHLRFDYDPFVSLRHAEVRRAPAGFEVADLYSSNGTLLEWHPLPRGGRAPLASGDVIGVGSALVVFRWPA